MAKITIKKNSASRSSAAKKSVGRPRRVSKEKVVSPGDYVIGTAGWLLAALFLVLAGMSSSQAKRDLRRIESSLDSGGSEQQEQLDVNTEKIAVEKRKITAELNAKIDLQGKLDLAIQTLERDISKLSPKVEKLKGEREELTAAVAKLKAANGETTQALAEATQKRDELAKKYESLKGKYKRRFAAMKQDYQEVCAQNDAGALRLWFRSHSHTVFAPAAAYKAGDVFYSKRRNDDAIRMYQELIRLYPNSGYVQKANARLEQIQARVKYEPVKDSFELYAPLLKKKPTADKQ